MEIAKLYPFFFAPVAFALIGWVMFFWRVRKHKNNNQGDRAALIQALPPLLGVFVIFGAAGSVVDTIAENRWQIADMTLTTAHSGSLQTVPPEHHFSNPWF